MSKPTSHRPLTACLTPLLVLMAAAGFSVHSVAEDGFHGAGIVKQCAPSKVGDSIRCNIRVSSLDDFGDDIRVLEAFDVVSTATGPVRDPLVGNLPITATSGNTTCEVGGTLPCDLLDFGSSVTFRSDTYVIQEGDGVVGPDGMRRLLDTARATYLDLCNGEPSVDCNPIDIQDLSAGGSTVLFEPSILVSKTGPDRAKVGDEVCWSIGFENTSSPMTPALHSCVGEDSFLGPLGAFTAGEPRTFCHTTSAADGEVIVNEASITCGITGFVNLTSDTDEHRVEIIDPAIEVTKTGPEWAKVGDEVLYTISLANTGRGELENCTGVDNVLGELGSFNPAGESRTFSYTVTASDPNPLVNTATITCGVLGFDNEVTASDSHSLNWVAPAIEVSKTGPARAKVGDEVTYTIGFANIGIGALEDCQGFDDVLGNLGAFDPAGESRSFPYTVTAADANPLVNTATITCGVVNFDNQASDFASHSLQVIDPAVELVKQCSPDPVFVGQQIEWTLQVTNAGNAALDCLLNDPEAGLVDEAVSLGIGEDSGPITAGRLVLTEDFPSISNTASVLCAVDGFDNAVEAEASADCEVRQRDEEICRTPGFWGTHAGTENRRSTNLTQTVINAAGGELSVCGQTINNTMVGNVNSAVEAMCVRIEGESQRQLARQLTAMVLNCVVSGGGADCTGTSVEQLFAEANAACAMGGEAAELSDWIEQVDAFNNGYDSDCHERELNALTEIFDGISPFPGPAGSPGACSLATGNGVKVVPAM